MFSARTESDVTVVVPVEFFDPDSDSEDSTFSRGSDDIISVADDEDTTTFMD